MVVGNAFVVFIAQTRHATVIIHIVQIYFRPQTVRKNEPGMYRLDDAVVQPAVRVVTVTGLLASSVKERVVPPLDCKIDSNVTAHFRLGASFRQAIKGSAVETQFVDAGQTLDARAAHEED